MPLNGWKFLSGFIFLESWEITPKEDSFVCYCFLPYQEYHLICTSICICMYIMNSLALYFIYINIYIYNTHITGKIIYI